MGERSNNVLKSVSVYEVLGFVAKLRVQNPIEIDKQYLDGGRMPNWGDNGIHSGEKIIIPQVYSLAPPSLLDSLSN